jgi:hypothetical protein
MRSLLVLSFFVTTGAFAQNIDLKSFKNLLTQRQMVLERINAGMSKQLKTISKIPTELGPCEVSETAIQTVLKIEGSKIIVHSHEKYVPAATASCAGFESQTVSVLFYENLPSLAADLADLDASANEIRSISKAGEIVTMNLVAEGQAVTVKYDLSKPTFKNLIYTQDAHHTMNSFDMSDIDVNSIDLKNVYFCESPDSENCSQGDFSDILYY